MNPGMFRIVYSEKESESVGDVEDCEKCGIEEDSACNSGCSYENSDFSEDVEE